MHYSAVLLLDALTEIVKGNKTIEISTGVSGTKRITVVNAR